MAEMNQLDLADYIDELLVESLTGPLKDCVERLLLIGKTSTEIKAIVRSHVLPIA